MFYQRLNLYRIAQMKLFICLVNHALNIAVYLANICSWLASVTLTASDKCKLYDLVSGSAMFSLSCHQQHKLKSLYSAERTEKTAWSRLVLGSISAATVT